MTSRREFLDRMNELMRDLPEAERARLGEAFAGMIDDRIEAGMPEADAVSALGDPEALLRDVCPDAASRADLAPVPLSGSTREGIREIRIHLKNADCRIVRQALPEGVTAQLNASENDCFTWSLSDGVLTVREADEPQRGLFRRAREFTLILDGFSPERLIADSHGGDLEVRGIAVSELTVLSTSSGDVRVSRFTGAGRTEATARSGDIEIDGAEVSGTLKLESLSGDIDISHASADALRLRAASGDIELADVRAASVALGTTSGDISASGVISDSTLLCETTGGDIELTRADAPDVRASTTSGDINARLTDRPGGWDIQADTRSGDIRVRNPHAEPGKARMTAVSASGDIDIAVV